MPQAGYQFPFGAQSLKGMELDVREQGSNARTWAPLFAATAFDVQVAAATTSRQHTLNAGSRTSTGAAGEITATCDVFIVPDSPGHKIINRAFRSGDKVSIRRCLFGRRVATDTLAGGKTIAIAAADADGALTSATNTKTGGLVTFTGLDDIKEQARAGMTLKAGAGYYFLGFENESGELYASPSPDDGKTSGAVSVITGTTTNFPYIGAVVSAVSSGEVSLYDGRIQVTTYTGTVTVPIVPTDAAPGDDGNDLSTAQFSFALDDIGEEEYSDPTS